MWDYYVIHSRSLSDFAIARTEMLEEVGYKCYLPARDLDDSGLPSETISLILNAISQCKKAKMYWDGVSYGAIFDMGACMALGVEVDEIVWVKKGQIHSLVLEIEGRLRR